jgi:exopolyphosphatase / guanosine-5'-triphosphate,3'-diphosphate pyrophosphatase
MYTTSAVSFLKNRKRRTLPDNNYLAAVDLGTNSFHLIIVKVKKDGSLKIIDREKEVIRLGSHKGEDLSIISEDEIRLSVETLKRFKKTAETYNAKLRAVATSAVRESKNGEIFTEQVFKQTGIKVEVIKGHQEAELIFLGAKKALELDDKKVLCLDVGGGSTEFINGINGEALFAESVKIGSVRLSKKFFPNFALSEKSIKACSDYVENAIKSNHKIKLKADFNFAVGTSGTIQAVASIIRALKGMRSVKKLNGYTFNKDDFQKAYEIVMKGKTVEERKLIKGMELKRADIIPAGMIILSKIIEMFNVNEIKISDYALREGIILEMLEKNYKN